jgi:NADPH-dependent 2,4-dienoyl-CoA reductase/sulfur reductase-like enzyme
MRLLVLGGGPAGLNAALQGRELGAQVILIESDRLGGTSVNRHRSPGHGRPAAGPRAGGGSHAAFAE